MSAAPAARSGAWKWWVCGLLLFASMILYMDRQTLPNVATRITKEFQLNNEQYGVLEMMFGYAFAGGAFVFGIFADNWKVRWLYPVVLILWSTSRKRATSLPIGPTIQLSRSASRAATSPTSEVRQDFLSTVK